MNTYQIYQKINNVVNKQSLIQIFEELFADWGYVGFLLPEELQRIQENVRLIPLCRDNRLGGYLMFAKQVYSHNLFNYINHYYEELSSCACRVRQYHTEKENIKTIQILSNIQTIANSNLELYQVFHKIAKLAQLKLNFERASLTLLTKDKKSLYVYAIYDNNKTNLGLGKVFDLANSALEWILNNKQSNLTEDLLKQKVFKEDNLLIEEGYKSALRVPLFFKGEIIGAVNFNSRQTCSFIQDDNDFALKIASVLSYAVINARIIKSDKEKTEEITKQNRHLRILNNVLYELSDINEFKKSLHNLLKDICEEFKLDGSACYLKFETEFILEGEHKNNLINTSFNFDKHTMHHLNNNILISSDNKLIVPIKSTRKLLGAIIFYSDNIKDFYDKENNFLLLLTKQLSLVLENWLIFKSIKYAIDYDVLTGLYNKKKFYSLLRREISRSNRTRENLVLLIADIDDFKGFNDRYGHLIGDKILQSVSQLINKSLRKSDIAGRFGGEEFLILLPKTDEEQGHEYAERLSQVIKKNIKEYPITISIGLTELHIGIDDAVSIVKRADNALYEAKDKGKNQVIIASKG